MDNRMLSKLDYVYKILFIVALIVFILIWAGDLFVPMLIGGFIAFALIPVNQWLERKKIPRILAISLSLIVFIGVIGLFAYLVSIQLTDLVKNLPNLQEKVNLSLENTHNFIEDKFGLNIKEQESIFQSGINNASSYISTILLSTSGIIATIVQIPVYVFLFLLYRNNFKNVLISYFPVKKKDKKSWIQQVKNVIQGYVSGMSLVILTIATLNCIGLLILGIPYAIFFGVFSAVLTIIPYIGNFIGCSLPVLMALITKDSSWYAIGVIGVYIFIQFLEGNIITPKIMGNKVSINALAAIIALVIGGKILGIAGMIIAIPAMGVLKVILSHSNHLKPITLLMDDMDSKFNPEEDEVLED
ncbi:MAG: AI-2E family transporter [Bacteroidetes bacterium]|nr:AI-2E family transporter [Bacteroidota bacterium]MBU1371643.1 AI-2E family transporter [Bacteroidota bacterium]MBU2375529.1 AI-2E family transporter [Bacteroidota bacterium]